MRIFYLIFLFSSWIFACSGDCTACHSSIDYNDNIHNIMLSCKNCHTQENLAKMQMQESCGQDCFSCHNMAKINKINLKEHSALNACIECHKSLKAKQFNIKNFRLNDLLTK